MVRLLTNCRNSPAPAIFEPYFTDHHERRGFGLGLALCAVVARVHGGRIWVEAGAGAVGNVFVLRVARVAT
ncbi:MAG: ATP-binding protein [Kofleriaceae bacterium]